MNKWNFFHWIRIMFGLSLFCWIQSHCYKCKWEIETTTWCYFPLAFCYSNIKSIKEWAPSSVRQAKLVREHWFVSLSCACECDSRNSRHNISVAGISHLIILLHFVHHTGNNFTWISSIQCQCLTYFSIFKCNFLQHPNQINGKISNKEITRCSIIIIVNGKKLIRFIAACFIFLVYVNCI